MASYLPPRLMLSLIRPLIPGCLARVLGSSTQPLPPLPRRPRGFIAENMNGSLVTRLLFETTNSCA